MLSGTKGQPTLSDSTEKPMATCYTVRLCHISICCCSLPIPKAPYLGVKSGWLAKMNVNGSQAFSML